MSINSLFSIGQIEGFIVDTDSMPIQFAIITNLANHSMSTTNNAGKFLIDGDLEDSIKIQHVAFVISKLKVSKNNDTYMLTTKINFLTEVAVKPGFVIELFKRSCENTFNKLKINSVLNGYLKYIKTENHDTVIVQDMDIDVKRQKLNDFKKGEKIAIFKIQERSVCDSSQQKKRWNMNKYICPPINQFAFGRINAHYNSYKIENSEYIKLYLLSKKTQPDIISNFEIVIQKIDSCLIFFAHVYQGPFENIKEKKTEQVKTLSYTKYEMEDGAFYLSETFDKLTMPENNTNEKNIEMSLFFKTYDNGFAHSNLRPKGRQIRDNIFDSNKVKNLYSNPFWIQNQGSAKPTYDFENLINLQMH